MTKTYLFLEKYFNGKNRFWYILFSPIFMLLEFMTYRYFWKKIILPELITKDDIFKFLDKNEFGFHRGRLIKKDILDDNEFYDSLDLEQAKEAIKKEFVSGLTDLINAHSTFDIEEYLVLIVTTELKLTHNKGEVYRNKLYTVTIQYCRYYYLQKCSKYFFF